MYGGLSLMKFCIANNKIFVLDNTATLSIIFKIRTRNENREPLNFYPIVTI